MTKSVGQAKQSAMEVNLRRSEYTETYQVRSELMKEKFKTILNRMPAQFEDENQLKRHFNCFLHL